MLSLPLITECKATATTERQRGGQGAWGGREKKWRRQTREGEKSRQPVEKTAEKSRITYRKKKA